jgi:formylglycine-generating enzyme required for sulfatase activity
MRSLASGRAVVAVLTIALFACAPRLIEGGPPVSGPKEPVAVASDATADDAKVPRGQEILGPGLGEFIFIAGGEFTMGRNDGEHEDQRPEHVVELSSFHVGRTPVTNSQFLVFQNEAAVVPTDYPYSQSKWTKSAITFSEEKWHCAAGAENAAANGGNWKLAERYCDWLSEKCGRKCRLPTEAEWEYVCRGKEGRKYPWGSSESHLKTRAWGWGGYNRPQPVSLPVGRYPQGATPEGVCDLIGYMDEMCSDWYDPEYYAKSPRENPKGPDEPVWIYNGQRIAKVTRGGLEHRYSTAGPAGYFRVSQYFGVLPATFLPRGWSRDFVTQPPSLPKTNTGVRERLGFRVVVEGDAEPASSQRPTDWKPSP